MLLCADVCCAGGRADVGAPVETITQAAVAERSQTVVRGKHGIRKKSKALKLADKHVKAESNGANGSQEGKMSNKEKLEVPEYFLYTTLNQN